jgi:two-component system, NtrC family, response regulator GlrR
VTPLSLRERGGNARTPAAASAERSLVVGASPEFLRSLWEMFLVAGHKVSVLLEGESGTGKELFSRAIHGLSDRRDALFVAVNCAALPRELLESELFGHVRGSFTGADRDRPGLVEKASGGTLFLDEIASMDLSIQAKLLRFLDDGEFRRVGDREVRSADVRVVAASNARLAGEAEAGRFRADLYYRLASYVLRLPPLRERRGDVAVLWKHFAEREAERLGAEPPRLSAGALAALAAYPWPGNVRELQNMVTQTVLRLPGCEIAAVDLPIGGAKPERREQGPLWRQGPLRELKEKVVESFERDYLTGLLRDHAGNVTRAARAAGKHRRALTELLHRYELDPEEFRR